MTTESTTLGNGMRIVSHHMAHLETTSLGVWVGAGARHETAPENGISHFLEHMAFKGTARRTARQIAEEIEAVGGDLNAATSLESTAYFARVLSGDEGVALDILGDILLHSSYADDEIEREREVILQEIAGIADSPDELAYDLLQDAAFPMQAVGRPVIGTKATVSRVSASDLRGFLKRRYVPGRMVLSAAGAVDHGVLVRHAEALFGSLIASGFEAGEPATYAGGTRASAKPFEQSHLVLGFKGPAYREPAFYDSLVFSGLFGGGMSSRLFQEVRENRGLCYAIYSSAWALADTGMFTIHAATGLEMMDRLISVIGDEMRRAAERAPDVAEVARAKAQLKAGLLMSLESSSARAEQMARQLINLDRLVSTQELMQRVDDVSAERLQEFAATHLGNGRPSVAVVGAGRGSEAFASRAAEAAAA